MRISEVITVPTLSQEVYKRLRKDIMNGIFPPGKRISIRKLAYQLNVSTMPVREALNKLQSEGFVHFERRSIFVRQLSSQELIELFEIRLTLEKMALEWSYKHIDCVALARLSEIVLEMERKLTSPAEWNELNRQFHTLIYTYAQSKPMLEMLSIVWGRVEPYMNIYSTKLDYLIISQKEHEQLLEVLIKKDIATLHHVLTLHIRQTKEAILEKLEK
ncbi:GntR family transcriptional regulator [Cytobacillus kochii]|uniref:HTH gntR-type domain-containing protein n=1 Tax=Cytobacillus kochii TaxID=859143 RepID=A0A248TFK9_9BACI|nr:GntR family transcriptional regulator [Cytobacillus kochii]ASV66977.1 hypothetical protein CKF48_06330 [Cytobacillus kochii]